MASSPDTPDFNFSEKEQLARTTVLVLVKARGEDGRRYYAYAAVAADKLPALARAQRSGKSYHLQEYGTVLEAGEGAPPPGAEQRMEEHYGFDHEKMITLSDDAQ